MTGFLKMRKISSTLRMRSSIDPEDARCRLCSTAKSSKLDVCSWSCRKASAPCSFTKVSGSCHQEGKSPSHPARCRQRDPASAKQPARRRHRDRRASGGRGSRGERRAADISPDAAGLQPPRRGRSSRRPTALALQLGRADAAGQNSTRARRAGPDPRREPPLARARDRAPERSATAVFSRWTRRR